MHAAAEDRVLQGQTTIKNGSVAEANSAVVDLVAFNVKAHISAALQHMKDAESALHDLGYSPQGLTRSLYNARESLEEGWQDTHTAYFANTGIKHIAIAVADVGARSVHAVGARSLHAGFCNLRAQALRIGTGTHSEGHAMLTKDITASASCNYKAHVSCLASLGPSPQG